MALVHPNNKLIPSQPNKRLPPVPRASPFLISTVVLGRGSFSVVKLAKNQCTGKEVAAKIIDLRNYPNEFAQEVAVLKKLRHENIVELYHYEKIRSTGFIYLEQLPLETLEDHLLTNPPFSEVKTINIAIQITDALSHMHKLRVSHHDLKTGNISYNRTTETIKIFDFGLSLIMPKEIDMLRNSGGSPLYTAPEALKNEVHNPFLADVYSCGIVMYEMLTCNIPNKDCQTIDELLKVLYNTSYIPLLFISSPWIKQLLGGMLLFDPSKRSSLESVRNMLHNICQLPSWIPTEKRKTM